MGLYIEDFLPMISGTTGSAPSTILITHNKIRDLRLLGVTESDVTVSLQNQFGPLLPDVTSLQDIEYLLNSANVTSYAMTSNQVWKGTAPLTFSLDFYVVNYKKGLNYKEQLRKFTELCTITPSSGSILDSIRIHGGYYPNLFTSNAELNASSNGNKKVQEEDGNNEATWRGTLAGADIDAWKDIVGGEFPGTLTVQVGSTMKIRNLLLTKIDITPSVVEVCDNANGTGAQPLYYRVGASFTTCRAAMSSDVQGIFR